MSTRATLSHGPTFHLFEEVFDEEHVYLELTDTDFEVTPGRVLVQVPLAIWEVIRVHSPYDARLADLDDEALLALVEAEVDARVAKRERFGFGVYGSSDDPREAQLERGLTWHRERRAAQRRVRAEVRRLEAGEGSSTSVAKHKPSEED